MGTGSDSVSSISKIRKITAIKKNRNEKGSRAILQGSKPHSNGDDFSRSASDFFDTKIITKLRTHIIKTETKNIRKIEKIKI